MYGECSLIIAAVEESDGGSGVGREASFYDIISKIESSRIPRLTVISGLISSDKVEVGTAIAVAWRLWTLDSLMAIRE